jgi:hypothetical protein
MFLAHVGYPAVSGHGRAFISDASMKKSSVANSHCWRLHGEASDVEPTQDSDSLMTKQLHQD